METSNIQPHKTHGKCCASFCIIGTT